jgi:NADH-quinone oxidoreductase subunit M
VDGISLFLILLTTFLVPLAILSGWKSVNEKAGAYFVHLLAVEALMLGFFMAVDVFLLYVFWTAMLVPIALLIEAWGSGRTTAAATKFIGFTMAGNLLVLAVILFCSHVHNIQSGSPSFDLRLWMGLVLDPATQNGLFLAAFLGFAVTMVLPPFHLWHPDALANAPAGGGVILAGIFLKVGAFGLLRLAVPLFPQAARSWEAAIVTLAVVGILWGAARSLFEGSLKRRLGFLNVTHLGLVTLGIFSFRAIGVEGALYLMWSHGLFVAAYLILVEILNERWCTYEVRELGGLLRAMPLFGVLFFLTAMAFIGVPGLNGFVGIARIFEAWIDASPALAAAAGLGVLIAAVSILKTYKETMLGPLTSRKQAGRLDLGLRELLTLTPLILVILWMGLSPQSFLRFTERSVEVFVSRAAGGAVFPE